MFYKGYQYFHPYVGQAIYGFGTGIVDNFEFVSTKNGNGFHSTASTSLSFDTSRIALTFTFISPTLSLYALFFGWAFRKNNDGDVFFSWPEWQQFAGLGIELCICLMIGIFIIKRRKSK